MAQRQGKIARLPVNIREQLNRRLADGESGKTILAWLNGVAEVKAILDAQFNGQAIRDDNLSGWRSGGYLEWVRRRDRVEHTRELAQWSVRLAQANGGNLADGAASLLSGQIMEILEGLQELREKPENAPVIAEAMESLTLSVARLRKGDQGAEQVRINREKLAHTEQELALLQRRSDQNEEQLRINRERLEQANQELQLQREKFQRQTCELFLKWASDRKAMDLTEGAGSNAEKIEALGQLMFWRRLEYREQMKASPVTLSAAAGVHLATHEIKTKEAEKILRVAQRTLNGWCHSGAFVKGVDFFQPGSGVNASIFLKMGSVLRQKRLLELKRFLKKRNAPYWLIVATSSALKEGTDPFSLMQREMQAWLQQEGKRGRKALESFIGASLKTGTNPGIFVRGASAGRRGTSRSL